MNHLDIRLIESCNQFIGFPKFIRINYVTSTESDLKFKYMSFLKT